MKTKFKLEEAVILVLITFYGNLLNPVSSFLNYTNHGALWSEEECPKNQTKQSPIAFDTEKVLESEIRYVIDYNYRNSTQLRTTFTVPYMKIVLMGISGIEVHGLLSDMVVAFEAEEIHFHIPGDHILDGNRGDMEMHIVHNLSTSIPYRGDLYPLNKFIISIMFQADSTYSNSTFLDSLNLNTEQTIQNLDLSSFMSGLKQEFFFYSGSQCGPTCDEGVYWAIFKNKIKMSSEQFQDIKGKDAYTQQTDGNYRAEQLIGTRKVSLVISERHEDFALLGPGNISILMMLFIVLLILL